MLLGEVKFSDRLILRLGNDKKAGREMFKIYYNLQIQEYNERNCDRMNQMILRITCWAHVQFIFGVY